MDTNHTFTSPTLIDPASHSTDEAARLGVEANGSEADPEVPAVYAGAPHAGSGGSDQTGQTRDDGPRRQIDGEAASHGDDDGLVPLDGLASGYSAEPARRGEARSSDWHDTVGDVRAGDGDLAGALQAYKQAARHEPASPRRLTKLADGYAAADLPHKALHCYQRALQTRQVEDEEELTEAHLGLGDLCCTFAMSATAVRSYSRAVRARPRQPYYRWKLAVALAATGLYEQAERQLATALELAPRDAFYRFQLAAVYLIMRRDEEAIEALQRVVELAPHDEYYRLRLGAALLRAEQVAAALPHFEQAVRMAPGNPSYRTLLRYAYSRNQQEPAIAVDIEMLELGAYDEDFVRRMQRLAQPA